MPQEFAQDNSVFALIFENSVEGILVTNEEGKIVQVNPSCLKIFGYEKEEIIGQKVEQLMPGRFKEHHIRLRGDYAKTPKSRHSASSLEILGLHKSGKEIPLEISLSYVKPGDRLLVACFIVDITSKRKLERELRKERELTRQYLNVTTSIFLVLSRDERILMINKAGSKLLGYAPDELKGKNWFDEFIPEPERKAVRGVFSQMMKNEIGVTHSYENHIVRKGGELRLIDWHNTLLKNKNGEPEATLSSGVDVTEKRALEKEKTEALVQGQENERRRIAQELHDGLGQSISAIGLNLNALEPELKSFNEKFRKIYEEVKQKLSQTIEEVRTISRNLTPKILEDYGLGRALEHLCETVDQSTTVKITLNLHGDLQNLDEKVSLGLYRIIQEVMNNALRHAGPNHINVHLTKGKTELIGIVEDDGRGFDLCSKPEGMGLSNVRSRVELLNGELHIDSSKIGGTTVSINVPL